MEHRSRNLAALAVVIAASAAASPAAALADARADLTIGFTSQAPGSPTGLNLAVEYKNPNDPAAKPPALESARFNLPAGTRIDNDAAPRCHATDAEIRTAGRRACPPETQIGSGRLVALTGAGAPADPFDGEALFFNGEGEIVEIVVVRGSDESAGFDRISIEGSSLVAHPPTLPGGPPDGRIAIKRAELQVPAPAAGARPYLTTPASCPADGVWRGSGDFTFGDGGATTVGTATPCVVSAAPTLRLRVTPKVVRGGRRSAFSIRVSSSKAGCASGAAVRLGRARATTDASGRAVLRKFLSKTRTVTVRAAKPGCGRASAVVRVIRR